ncbi:TPA: PTS sugar transporter subunit IIB [Salmonella enterica subsp. diarizonae serovar 61:l,v:z35]
MKYILLCCAAGMSTSLLVQKMKEAALKRDADVSVRAIPVAECEENLQQADVILLGPQVRYEQHHLQVMAAATGKKVAVIDMKDYGLMDGDAVLEKALKLLEPS